MSKLPMFAFNWAYSKVQRFIGRHIWCAIGGKGDLPPTEDDING